MCVCNAQKAESTGYDNYTVGGVASKDSADVLEVTAGGDTGPTEFRYKKGFLFPARMWLNFSLTLNKDETLPVGSGEINGVFVVFPLCLMDVHFTYPKDDSTWVAAGPMYSFPFKYNTPGRPYCHVEVLCFFF